MLYKDNASTWESQPPPAEETAGGRTTVREESKQGAGSRTAG